MTTEKLQQILQNKEELTIGEIKQIICELKNDCVGAAEITNRYECGFYNGEMNAFYICLDLLDKFTPVYRSKQNVYADKNKVIPNLRCMTCERDVIICKEECKCMKEVDNA